MLARLSELGDQVIRDAPAVSASQPSTRGRWPCLFSPGLDLVAFLGSALAALLLLVVGGWAGLLDDSTPEWTWVSAVLLVDVAHVYATCFRVYFVPQELARRRWLYLSVPALSYVLGWALYSEDPNTFWRALAYVAVFHFVRQQYGWVALYRSRASETGKVGWWIDTSAIYLATLYPLIYWHAHLPRDFWWFVEDDFARLPVVLVRIVQPLYWLALIAYAGRSAYRGLRYGKWSPFKDIVVATTALCWHLGIITFNSDYAFTVTNVIIHGVPYMVLVYWHARGRKATVTRRAAGWQHAFLFLGTIWALAYTEELLWDRSVWHERSWLFGTGRNLATLQTWIVPLLAVPQLTHYILDGFIWKRRSNPELATTLKLGRSPRVGPRARDGQGIAEE